MTWILSISQVRKWAAEYFSRLSDNGNQDITHESTYATETMLELYNIKELPN